MSQDSAPKPSDDAAELLRDSLIRSADLSEEAVAKIAHAARVLGIDFCEAALSTGFVSQSDIDYARQSMRQVRTIHVAKAKPPPGLILPNDPFDTRSEKILALRTELLLRHDSDTRANMITLLSPCAGEGRSQLAAELALAFGQLGHPTLLVDTDLRKPRLHELFGAENGRGLSQAIAKRETPFLQPIENMPNLVLLTAGPTPLNPLELLSDAYFERMIKDWRHSFEFVILDTAPVTPYSDGLAVATLTGRVLVISRANHTPYKQQREMLRRLTVTRAQILGGVINHF